jgi:hypothetical protein
MVASVTDPATTAPESSRRWSPDGTDHLIFQWVKLKGHSQDWVATQLGLSQSTVSRVVQRYERWQAHAKEREGGRLDHAERLRAQRWLTFERNEALLASCLRIANEMEGFTDVSKSTIRRGHSLTDEREVCTQHSTIDRSGIAARFLRLAFRINMEQLKLCELDPPPPAEPLSDDELAAELLDAAAAAAEILKDTRVHERSEMHQPEPGSQAPAWEPTTPMLPPRPCTAEGGPSQNCVTREDPGNEVEASAPPVIEPATGSQAPAWEPATPRLPPRPPVSEGGPSRECVTREDPGNEVAERDSSDASGVEPDRSISSADSCTRLPHDEPAPAAPLHHVHILHNDDLPVIAATAAAPCSCTSLPAATKISPICITTPEPSPPLVIRLTPDTPLAYSSSLGSTTSSDELTTGSQAPAWEPATPRLPPRPCFHEGGPSQQCVTREDPGNEL